MIEPDLKWSEPTSFIVRTSRASPAWIPAPRGRHGDSQGILAHCHCRYVFETSQLVQVECLPARCRVPHFQAAVLNTAATKNLPSLENAMGPMSAAEHSLPRGS